MPRHAKTHRDIVLVKIWIVLGIKTIKLEIDNNLQKEVDP